MRRKHILIAFSGVLVLVFAVVGLLAWVAGTTAGARLAIRVASALTPLDVSAGRIQGRLWDEIYLDGVHIGWTEGDVLAEAITLKWQPMYLLTGDVIISELHVKGLRIEDRSPEERIDLRWPAIEGFPARVNGWIDSLQISGLSYRKAGRESAQLRRISSALIWYDTQLTLRNVSIDADFVTLSGTISAGFERPFLSADARIMPVSPPYGVESFLVRANLKAGTSPVQIEGPVKVVAMKGGKEDTTFTAFTKVMRYAVTTEDMIIRESGRRGSLEGRARIDFGTQSPQLSASLQLVDLDLSPEVGIDTHLAGTVSVEGPLDNYAGAFRLTNAGRTWRFAEIDGSLRDAGCAGP